MNKKGVMAILLSAVVILFFALLISSSETSWIDPTQNLPGYGVYLPENAYDADDDYATFYNDEEYWNWHGYDFSFIPSGSIINGIEVNARGRSQYNSGIRYMEVRLSWNNGSTWSDWKSTETWYNSISNHPLGSSVDDWGHSWTREEIVNNFRVQAKWQSSGTYPDARLTHLPVRIYYNESIFIDDVPNIELNYPPKNYQNNLSDPIQVNFNCSITDDHDSENLSLYLSNPQNTSFVFNDTCIIPSVNGSCSWTKILSNGNYTWNCLGYDNFSQFDWGKNRSIVVNYYEDTSPPIITLERPISGWVDPDGEIMFEMIPRDQSIITECSLIINGDINQTKTNIIKNTKLKFNHEHFTNGYYTWYVNCTDNKLNTGPSQVRNFTVNVTPELIEVYEKVEDSSGNPINVSIKILNPYDPYSNESNFSDYDSYHQETVEEGVYDIKIQPENISVEEIVFHDCDLTHEVDEIVDIDPELSEEAIETEMTFVKSYAINPKLNFTNASVKITAKGQELWKCVDWNFSTQTCYGDWEKVMNLVPGQQYTFTLTPQDPGFLEIIPITKALHLNENKSLIENIFSFVNNLDDVWKWIPENHFVRITFQKNLTSSNDITIYAQSNESGSVEVYEKNSDVLLATFGEITGSNYYKILLTNLTIPQDTFDLKIINGGVLFDYIFDPIPSNFVNGEEANSGAQVTSLAINVPSGTQENDLMIAIVGISENEDSGTQLSTPTGWEQVADEDVELAVSDPNVTVFIKVASASEPSSYTWSNTGTSTGMAGHILTYRGVGNLTGNPISQIATADDGGVDGCPIAPSVDTAYANETVLYIGFTDDDEAPTPESNFYPSGTTGRQTTEESSGGDGLAIGTAEEVRSSTGPTGTRAFQNCQASDEWAAITITLLPALEPTINSIECEESSTWQDCSNINFGETITRVRVNCTGVDGNIANATFRLTNTPDSNIFFNANATSDSGDLWIYNNADLTINDSGQFNLDVVCYDDSELTTRADSNWTVAWGVLNADLIEPLIAKNVSQNKVFTFTSQITCSGGECGFVNATLDPPADWWNVSYTKRKEINITNSGSALTDFPVYLNISYESSMQFDYDDLRFMNETCGTNGSLLDYEIEYYNSSKADVWVRIPALSSGITSICMYYGNSSVSSGTNPTGVWDSDYASVYHLNHTTGDAIDSTGSFNLTDGISPDSNKDVAGVVGRGDYFDGGDSLGLQSWDLDDTGTTAHTYCAWVSYGSTSTMVIAEDGAYATGTGIGMAGGNLRFGVSISSTHYPLDSLSTYNNNEWHYICGVSTGTQSQLFVDGEMVNSASPGTISVGTDDGRVGAGSATGNAVSGDAGDYFFTGYMDEMRLSYEDRSADWINMTYQIVANQNNVVVTGDEEDSLGAESKGAIPIDSGTPFYTTNQNPMDYLHDGCLADMKPGRACNITWTVNATGPINNSYDFFVTYESLNYSGVSDNQTDTVNVTIIIDHPPGVLLTYPPVNYFYGDSTSLNLYFNASVSDDQGLANCSLWHNATGTWHLNETKDATGYSNTTFFNKNIYANKYFFWNVQCYDTLYQDAWADNNRTVFLDGIFPIVDYALPTDSNGTKFPRLWIYVNASVTETNLQNITFDLYFNNGTQINSTTFTDNRREINWTNLYDLTTYFYNVTVFDSFNHSNSTSTRTITLDTTVPSVTFGTGTPPNFAVLPRSWLYVNVSVQDSDSETNITFALYNETHEINKTTFTNPQRTINWTSLSDAVYYYNVSMFEDDENDYFSSSTRQITLDITLPNATLLTPENNTYSDNSTQTNFTVNLTDNVAGLSNATLFIYNSLGELINQTTRGVSGTAAVIGVVYTFINDGVYNWFYRVFDLAGNKYDTQNNTLTIDATYPLISYETGTEDNYLNLTQSFIYVDITATEDNEANITFDLYFENYTLLNSSTYIDSRREINWTDLSDSIYYYNVTLTDLAYNQNTTQTRQIGLDNAGPSITIIAPENGKIYSSNISMALNHTVSDAVSGLSLCWWNLDNGANQTVTCNTNTVFNTTDGAHDLYFYSNDTLGNLNHEKITFSVALYGPAITLSTPENNTYFTTFQNVEFNYSAYDPDGVDFCSLYGTWSGGWHKNQTQDLPEWYDLDWEKRKAITIPSSKVQSDLTDFPLLVEIYDEGLHDYTQSNGYDILFTSDDALTKIPHEIELFELTYNSTHAHLVAWVKTNLTSALDTTIYMYYNNSDSSNQQNSENVWDEDYTAVWHMDEVNIVDSTSNGNTGTATSMDSGNLITGVLGTGLTFSAASTDYITVSDAPFDFIDNFTVTTWIRTTDDSDDWARVIDKINRWTTGWGIGNKLSAGYGFIAYWDPEDWGGDPAADFGSIYNNSWYLITSVMENGVVDVYTNGVLIDTYTGGSGNTLTTNDLSLTIGKNPGVAAYWTGSLDEIRISNTSRSAAWVNTSFQNQINPASFTILGTEDSIDFSFTLNLFQEGRYDWNIWCNDTNDYESYAVLNYTFTYDNTPPQVDFADPTAPDYANLSQNWIYVNTSVIDSSFKNITFRLYHSNLTLFKQTTYTNSIRFRNWTNLQAGNYKYNFTVFDYINLSNTTSTRKITIDGIGPTVNLLNPGNNSYSDNSSQTNFTVNITDNFQITNYTINIFNETGHLIYEVTRVIVGTSILIGEVYDFIYDGVFQWMYKAFDIGGNLEISENRTITIDTIYPLIDYLDGVPENYANLSQDWVHINLSITEENLANMTFNLYFENYTIANSTTFTTLETEINWTNLEDGIYYYNVSIWDLVNFSNTTQTRRISLDNAGPVITIISPITKVYGYNESLSLNHTVTDTPSGTDMCWWNLDNTANQTITCNTNTTFNATNGEHTLYFYSNDTLGFLSLETVTFSISIYGPGITLSTPENNTVSNAVTNLKFNFTAYDPDNVSVCSLWANWSGAWHLNSTLDINNESTIGEFFMNLSESGDYIWNVECNDTFDYVTFGLYNRTIKIDATPPQIEFISPTLSNNSNSSNNWVYANVSITEPNFQNLTFNLYFNNHTLANSTTYTDSRREINFTGLQDGIYRFNATSYDSLGNQNTTDEIRVRLDLTSPSGNLISPGDNNSSKTSSQNLTINATDENGLGSMTLLVYNSSNGVLLNSTTQAISGKQIVTGITFNFPSQGEYKWTYKIIDVVSNNYTFSNYTFAYDLTLPNATILSPENNTYTNTSAQNLTVNATDDYRLSNVTIFIYNSVGTLINQTTRAAAGTVAVIGIVYDFVSDGVYSWFYRVFDAAGNKYDSKNQTLTYDETIPLIDYISPTEDNYENLSQTWIYVNVSLTETNTGNTTFYLYDSDGLYTSTTYTDSTLENNWTGLPSNTYYYNVTHLDLAGNVNSTSTRQIGLDSSGPTITIISPEAIVYSYNESLPLNHTVTDVGSGLSMCWWNLDEGQNQTITCNTNTTFNTTDGLHDLYFYANDTFGNFALVKRTFSTSIYGPATNLLSPENNTYFDYFPNITFEYDSYDPDGVDFCSLYGTWSDGWHLNQTRDLPDWYEFSWAKRKEITIDSDKVQGDLSDFPVLIDIYDEDLHDYARSDGYDVLFTSSDGLTKLSHEIELFDQTYNSTHAHLIAWVRADLTGSSDTTLYMYYNYSDSSNQESSTDVWINNYVAVHHLSETSGNHEDSSPIGNDATDTSVSTQGGEIGQIYRADDFDDGNTDYVTFSNSGMLVASGTMSLWANMDASTGTRSYMFSHRTGSNSNRVYFYEESGTLYVGFADVFSNPLSYTIPEDEWHYYTLTWNGANWTAYVDGEFEDTASSASLSGIDANFHIGSYVASQEWFDGIIDEVIVSNITRAYEWVNTSFQNQDSPSSFYSVSSRQTPLSPFYGNVSSEGRFYWNIWCNDTVPYETFSLYNFTFIIDMTYPQVDFGANTAVDYANLSQNWVYVNVSITEPNEKNITFDIYYENYTLLNSTTFINPKRTINWTGLSTGIYYYNVTVFDYVNLSNTTSTRTITLDWEEPDVTLISPENNTYSDNSTQTNFTVNITDNFNIKNYTLEIFNQTGHLIYTVTRVIVGASILVGEVYDFIYDGVFQWMYKAFDFSGNLGISENRTITIDTTYPLIDYLDGVPEDYTNISRDWIHVNVSVTEANEVNITFDLYFQNYTILNSTIFTTPEREINWTGLNDGIYYYNVTVWDIANHSNITQTKQIGLDTTPPNITLVSPENNTYVNESSQNLTLSAQDSTSLSNMTLLVYNHSNGNLINQTSQDISGSDILTGIVYDFPHDGVFKWTYKVFDSVGNSNLSQNNTLTYDSAYPLIDFSEGTEMDYANKSRGWIYVNVSVVEANEANITFDLYFQNYSLVNSSTYTDLRREINWTGLPDETYYYNVTVVDLAYNVNTTQTMTINLDRVPPQIEFVPATEDNYANFSKDWIYANASITEPHKANTTFNLYFSNYTLLNSTVYFDDRAEINWTSLENGKYYYNVTCFDFFDNQNTTETREIILDTSGPVINITSPDKDTIYTYNESIPLEYSITDLTPLSVCFWNLDNTANQTVDCSTNTTINATDGVHDLYFYVNDSLNNWGFEWVNLSISIYGPNITLIYPENHAVFNNTADILFNYTATDLNGPDTCELWENWTGTWQRNQTAPFVHVNFTEEDEYFWGIWCNDSAGNESWGSENYTFIIDATYPQIEFVSPTLDNNDNSSKHYIFVNVSVTEPNEANITFNLYFSNYTIANSSFFSTPEREINWSLSTDGIYYYNVISVDKTYKVNTTKTRKVNIDFTGPNITLLSPEDNYYSDNSSQTNFTVNITDNFNIKNYTLEIFNQTGHLIYTVTKAVVGTSIIVGEVYDFIYEGIFKWMYKSFDFAGNLEMSDNRTIVVDTSNPLIDFVSPTKGNDTFHTHNYIYVNVSIIEANLGNTTFNLYFDNYTLLNSTNCEDGRGEINWTGISDGTYYYNVTHTDLVLRVNSTETRSISLDTIYPQITFASPTPGNNSGYARNWIFVNVSVVEVNEINITFELYDIDGLANLTTFITPEHEINFTDLTDGTYYFNVTVSDLGNHTNTSATITTFLDNVGPEINITKPEYYEYFLYNSGIPLNFTIYDDLGVDDCWYNIDNGENITIPSCQNTTFDVPGEEEYKITLYANDTGNNLASDFSVFLVSNQGPSVVLVYPYNDNLTNYSTIYFNYTITDPATGAQGCKLWGDWNGGWHLNQSSVFPWWHSDWLRRRQINITNAGSEDLIDYPLYLNLSSSPYYKSDFHDIRFINGSCPTSKQHLPTLDYEIVNYTSDYGEFYVRIPVLYSGVTEICMYYFHDTEIYGDNPAGVWNDSYTSVYHLEHTSGIAEDLKNNFDAEEDFYPDSNMNIKGKIGLGDYFDGNDSLGNNPEWNVDRAHTYCAWINFTNAHDGTILEDGGNTDGHGLGVLSTGQIRYAEQYNNNPMYLDSAGTYNDGQWHYVCGGHTGSVQFLYIDGELETSASQGDGLVGNDNARIGQGNGQNPVFEDTSTHPYNGSLDELMVSNIARTADWINMSYQAVANPENVITYGTQDDFADLSFFLVTIAEDGFFKWNLNCNETEGNNSWYYKNVSFAVFLPPEKLNDSLINISQTKTDGTGDVILQWNATPHTYSYRVYSAENATGNFTYLGESLSLNYTDENASDDRRRFYRISAWNPTAENNSYKFFGKTVYYLKRKTNVNTRNWIGFYILNNLSKANDTINIINNATTFTTWNSTTQKRVTCNKFSCPDPPGCTDTNCNFDLKNATGYEVNVNSTFTNWSNWSVVGTLINDTDLDLVKGGTFGKNWVSVYYNTTLESAHSLITSVSYADAVTHWDTFEQTSRGYIDSPFPWVPYIGINFSIEPETGYEVSVTQNTTYTQT